MFLFVGGKFAVGNCFSCNSPLDIYFLVFRLAWLGRTQSSVSNRSHNFNKKKILLVDFCAFFINDVLPVLAHKLKTFFHLGAENICLVFHPCRYCD